MMIACMSCCVECGYSSIGVDVPAISSAMNSIRSCSGGCSPASSASISAIPARMRARSAASSVFCGSGNDSTSILSSVAGIFSPLSMRLKKSSRNNFSKMPAAAAGPGILWPSGRSLVSDSIASSRLMKLPSNAARKSGSSGSSDSGPLRTSSSSSGNGSGLSLGDMIAH